LKLDILKDNVIPSFAMRKIVFTYQDFKEMDCKINTYTLEAVVADKISRILDIDKEARDIYDIWFLLNLNLNIFKIKEELKNRFGYSINFNNLLEAINSGVYKKTWEIRLSMQIRELPSYDLVKSQLGELIKNKFI
jgi:predicted nucleotidyltransferase component of viral defense system